MKRVVKIISLVVIALAIGALIAGGIYLLKFSLQPDGQRIGIKQSLQEEIATYPPMRAWLDSLARSGALHDTVIANSAGKKQYAMFAAAAQPTSKTALLVHGYTDRGIRMLRYGYLYHRLGYNMLIPDLHAHGASEGTAIQMGWKDRLDVLQWAEVANALFAPNGQNASILIHGISMGAATTMCVSGEELPPYIRCFIEDCGYTSVWDEFSYELKEKFGLPAFPLLHVSNFLCKLMHGWSFVEASPIEQVKKCELPMLFIHGDADTYVPTRMVYPLFQAKPGPKELWITPNVKHAASFLYNPEEYTRRVKMFLDKYMN